MMKYSEPSRTKCKTAGGFTFVEVLFSVTIGLIILGIVMILYVAVNQHMTLGVALTAINSDARLAMDRITRDLRWGSQLETSRSVSGTNYVTGTSEIVIRVPSIDSNGEIIADTYDYVIYALGASDPTQLMKIVDPDAASSRSSMNQVIAQNVNSFTLSSGGIPLSDLGSVASATSVTVSLNVSKEPLQNKSVSETVTSNIELRNN